MLTLPRSRSQLLETLALATVYATVGVITLSLPETSVELRRMIWAPSGIALAWAMLSGIHVWPGIFLGAAVATTLTGGPPLHALGTAFGNAGEVILACVLLQRFGVGPTILGRRSLAILLGTLILTSALSAIVSVGSLTLTGGASSSSWLRIWVMWWLTHVMGQIVFGGVILAWPRDLAEKLKRVTVEDALLTTALFLSLAVNFTPLLPGSVRELPLVFLSFPFLFWAAYRHGQFGASLAAFVTALFAVPGTLLGIGPFAYPSAGTSLFLTLSFVGFGEVSALFIAGLVAERREAERQRERMERRVQRSERLESLGALAGGIAHDFNNLLVAIAGNVDLVLMDTDPSDPAHEPLDHSIRASERAAELCRQLLAYAGQGPVERAVVDLGAIVEDMASLLRIAIPKGAELGYRLAADVIPVEADTSQLRQVVVNLLTNAGEALAESGGTIEIRTGQLDDFADFDEPGTHFLEPPTGPVALLAIRDTGEGIPRENVERIFEPMFTTRGRGRGLGLASVLGIMRGHEGSIHLATSVGSGSTFTLILPLTDRPIERVPVPPLFQRTDGEGLALIVDDEPAVARAAALLVGRLGFETVQASSGAEALEKLEAVGHDVTFVLLDMTMPGMSGLDTLHAIRELGWHMPVLLSSGYLLEPRDTPSSLEPVGFLPKPYTVAALASAIDELLTATTARV